MHERGIFLDVFLWRALLKKADNMMWNLLSPLNWFHYGTSNYKSTMWKARERQGWGVWGVEIWAFLSCRHTGCFIAISQHLPWMADIMWRCNPEKKITISTGMYCHILIAVYITLWNLGQKLSARFHLICSLLIPMSPKLCKKVSLRPRNMTLCNSDSLTSVWLRWECFLFFFPWMDQVLFYSMKVKRDKPNWKCGLS